MEIKIVKKKLEIFFIISVLSVVFFGILLLNPNINVLFAGKNNNNQINPLDPIIPKISRGEEWNDTYGFNYQDVAYGIVGDSEGNIYITGKINHSSSTSVDIITRKYKSNGTLEWERIVDGDGVNTDVGYDIAVDSEDNVYVTGYITNQSGIELIVIKYNKTGDFIWKYNQTGTGNLIGFGITIDRDDNIYVLGRDGIAGVQDKLILMRLNKTDGEQVWEVYYQTITFNLNAGGICTDYDGNIYITGYNNSGSATDIQIAKYDSLGNPEWNETRNIKQYDNAYDIAINSDNEIFILGKSTATSQNNIALLRYNSIGTFQEIIYPLGESHVGLGLSLVIDNSTNEIYIAGYDGSVSVNNTDVLVIKCNSSGNQEWNMTWDFENMNDIGNDIFIDSKSIYVAGSVDNTTTTNIALIKFNLTPSPFTLSLGGYGNPDNDGNIELEWGISAPIDADNYTVYNSTSFITEINSSLGINAKNIQNTSLMIENLTDGKYYYIIEAHNKYGNSTSNCEEVNVLLTPGSFTINCTADQPDDDGIFWLNWSKSDNARNYTIRFRQGNYIGTDVQTSGAFYDMVPSSIQSLQINSSLLPNDNYSIRVWAHNYDDELIYNVTQESSNYVTVSLGIPPGTLFPISISSPNAGNPDTDKEFILEYGQLLDKATRYEVYYSTSKTSDITKMNLLVNDTNRDRSFSVTEATALPDGTLYFIVVGFNAYGNYTSEILTLTLGIVSGDGIPWWVYPIITGIISACVGIAIKQTYSSVKKRRIFMQNVQDKFEKIDNIENFLKEKLGYDEWQRLQGHVDKYKKHQISNKDLIKVGKKELGKDFTDIFIGKKKPKK